MNAIVLDVAQGQQGGGMSMIIMMVVCSPLFTSS